MEDTVKINIGGVYREIASYENLLLKEPGNIEMGVRSLSPFQYNSILFFNLGYKKCPKDLLWQERNVPIEKVSKTEIFDYPITHHRLMFIEPTLYNVIEACRYWIKGGLERGHLLDINKAFQLPSTAEIKYNFRNKIKIMRTSNIKSKIEFWDKADIYTRRIYNMNPNFDTDYFEYSLIDYFDQSARLIEVDDPYALFASCLIDPDILLSAIRQAEKEAAHIVANRNINIPVSMLDTREISIEFRRTFNIRAKQISNIYRSRGAKGFVNQEKEASKNILTADSAVFNSEGVHVYSPEEQESVNIIFQQIATTPLDGTHKGEIMTYIEPNTLKFLDRLGEDSVVRIATYKRLWYTLNQLKRTNPELLNPKDKFVMSEGFYIDPDRFALYNKSRNKFYIVGTDLYIREMSPQEALGYYNVFLGKNVLLNPNEVGEGIEAPVCPEVDLNMMEMQALGLYGQMPVQIPQQPQPIPQQQYQVEPQNQTPEYGMSVFNLVEGI